VTTAVYPWRADGPGRSAGGVTDDPVAALAAATGCLLGWADSAVVEVASTGGVGAQTLAGGYPRTGRKWLAAVGAQGRVLWTAVQERAGPEPG
jgi:hypothetical protein